MSTLSTSKDIIEISPSAKQWKQIGIHHHHGLNVPLFSLRTKDSSGIGEFKDLIPMIDWCKSLGLDVLQLLPLNDTGLDTSPYSALSAFALNPVHLSLAHLPQAQENSLLNTMLKDLQKYNSTQRIDYQKLHIGREHFLQEYFKVYGQGILSEDGYRQFIDSNPWVKGYALFKAMKSYSGWKSWEMWPEEIKNPSETNLKTLETKFEYEIEYLSLIQYLCFRQMQEVKQYAEKAGVFLKGDIPILINRESADVWLNRHLFNMGYAAGAPPDMYSEEGQKWGFPIYNWDLLTQEDYAWWKLRLAAAQNFYHLYRIDHVVGFFRIWAIPIDRKAKEGHFEPRDKSTWIAHGKRIMRMMLESSLMLPIAEDLGVVPPDVRACLKSLGICGTKVMRWERHWEADKSFIPPEDYPPISMTTVSTHDSDTLQLWWIKSPEEAKEYCKFRGWEYSAPLSPEYQMAILYDSHHTPSFFHINLLNEYLALFPELVWPNPEDERINIPGLIADRNWSYRFRPSVEEIVENNLLADAIRDLIR